LRSLVRLRNLLVHRYWDVDDKRIYEGIVRDFACVHKFLEGVEGRYGR